MNELLVGRYRLVRELGSGAMGVVWLAHDTVLDRSVALKELRVPAGVDAQEAMERFLVEAQAVARLSHTSIVTVHDVFAQDDRVLMSLELLDGPTLADVVAVGGMGSGARPVMLGIAEALAAAHGEGVVHRDLKPENVFLLPSGRVVVCDFGLARIGAGRGTHAGTVMGTPGYMAPEQVRGLEVGPAADVFAWGAVAYELASGVAPFGDGASEDFVTLSWRIVHEDPPELVFEDDPELWPVIATALAKDPGQRFASGASLVAALTGSWDVAPRVWSGPESGVPSMPPGEGAKQGGEGRRGLMIAGVVAGLVVLALAGLLGMVLLTGPPVEPPELTTVTTTREPPRTDGVPQDRSEPRGTLDDTRDLQDQEPEETDEPPEESGVPTTGAATESELHNALRGYIQAMDSGDVDLAHAYVSPSLRQQAGWSYERFAAFRNERITGCRIVSIDGTRTGQGGGIVEATVDYDLPDGGVSRETIRTEFVRGPGGELLLDAYEVLSSRRLGG